MENEQIDELGSPVYLGARRRAWLRNRAYQRLDRSMSAVVRELIDKELAAELEAKESERVNARMSAMESLVHQLDATNLRLKQELDAEKNKKRAKVLTRREMVATLKRAEHGERCMRQVQDWQSAGHTPAQVVELCKVMNIRTPEGRKPHRSTILKWMGVANDG